MKPQWIGLVMKKLFFPRLLIGIVFFFNVQSALLFIVQPARYTVSFELSGEIGVVILRSIGILFLMWNVPYFFALYHPFKNFTSLIEANIMQFIGLLGESLLLLSIDPSHTRLSSSILRFIIFDGSGLVMLIASAWLVIIQRHKNE